MRGGGFDAVVLIDDLNVALAALPMLALAILPGGPPLAAICHEPRPRNRWSGGGMYVERGALHRVLHALYRHLDLVLVHGERSRAEFQSTWGPTPTAVIPHGNEGMLAKRDLPPADEERILFFGDWRRSKGLPELMEAFDQLRERRPEARLTIAGTPYADGRPEAVRAWAREHGEAVSVIDSYVPTSPNVADCPAGTYHLLFRGEPVVNDATGAPVCVTADANGNAGSATPGQPGENGGDSNTEGDVTYGQLPRPVRISKRVKKSG